MSDQADSTSSTSYVALVTALLGVRPDPATTRFDEELAAAEVAGTLDPSVARTLRWWQRESLRGVEDHVAAVLPVVLATLAAAERAAHDAVAASAESWTVASGGAATAGSAGYPRPIDIGSLGTRADEPHASAPRVLRPGFAPPAPATPDAPPGPPPSTRPDDPVAHDSGGRGAPPRRLLVAGLTVLPDDDTPHGDTGTDGSQHGSTSTPPDGAPRPPG